jgi:uncharacterized protein
MPGSESPPEPVRGVVAFGRILRRAGLAVGTGRLLLFAQALDLIETRKREDVYWSARSTLVTRPEDLPVFDAAFGVFWDGSGTRGGETALSPQGSEHPTEPTPLPEVPAGSRGPHREDRPRLSSWADGEASPIDTKQTDQSDQKAISPWSPVEVLRAKDFSDYGPDEYLLARRLMSQMRASPPLRISRRPRPAPRGALDLRRTFRTSLRTAGVPIKRDFRRRAMRPRRLVLIADVSGSMERYSRALLQFLQASVAGARHVEAFVFGTRLTRVTKELRGVDPDRALTAAARAVVDWGGGTRIAEAIATFNDQWGARGVARGAIVVILSDGWERGDVNRLGQEMGRLSRLARRVVWVNPLKAAPGYAPLAAGMAAALPHVDDFVEGHNLASLEGLSDLFQRISG